MKILKGKIRKRIEIELEVDADMAADMGCELYEKPDEEIRKEIREFLYRSRILLPFEKAVHVKATTLVDDSDFKDRKFYGD